jgi:hypothetical protein
MIVWIGAISVANSCSNFGFISSGPAALFGYLLVRERPFNLGGGMVFFYKNILIPNVAEKNILILVEEKK